MHSSNPAAIAKFRERTKNATAQGTTLNTFRCKRCLQTKSTSGRKRMSDWIKDGWICAHCHEVRETKRAAKKLLVSDNS